ncbi:phosphoglycolate phosphatase [Lichtheimia corymbifera JMRC:FSU:9682]|uniref:Phosphoglycolate phosphatase n=1 Tax=Lichtheimia corymbifera JMRC:FSU:9682 TaxID=1263082 RepID=A0A068S827_9FUNG|nr:phosphoglycolate phosphatase [Lichtheimia corymbifera JMRC:FSU:9682]
MADDAALQKEQQWKDQVATLHAKLTQAGNHLKTLAQENARLNQQLAQHNSERETHDNTVNDLLKTIGSLSLDDDTPQSLSAPEATKLVETVKARMKEKEEKATTKIESLENQVKTLSDQLEDAKKEASAAANQSTRSSKEPSKDKDQCDVDLITKSLTSLLEEDDDSVFPNELPLQVRSAFENVRQKWSDKLDSIKEDKKKMEQAHNDLQRQLTKSQLGASQDKDQWMNEKQELEAKLQHAEKQHRESEERVTQLQQEHQSLLGKLAHIKETLAPRLEADKQLRQQVSDLTARLETAERELTQTRADRVRHEEEMGRDLAAKERMVAELQAHMEQVQQEREEWEAHAMQSDAQRNQLETRCQQLTESFEELQHQQQKEKQEHELERASLANLQTVLEEFQTTKDAEVRAAVEHIERQLEVAKKSLTEYQERARVAESALDQYQQDVAKTQKYEQEIKEKNLLIGKLRHEAIILNEHLIEAMRRLKEETSDSNVDRQLISNLIIGFLMAPRGDRKRFEILTIIASVLQMTDEQKEQVGLVRPKNMRSSPSSNSSSTPGWMSPQQQQQQSQATGESFTDAWISFLLKESSAYGRAASNTTQSTPASPKEKSTTDI